MAITTVYDGIEYRSRLEARWAAFMRNIGWDIVYEPFDGDGYIPDFLVQGPRPMLVEVKPAVTLAEYQAAVPKAEKGLAAHWSHDILIVGASPLPSFPTDNRQPGDWEEIDRRFPVGGVILEPITKKDRRLVSTILLLESEQQKPDHQRWRGGEPRWGICQDTGSYQIGTGSHLRPHGCQRFTCGRVLNSSAKMKSHWADACNDVKWRGRAA